MTTLALIAAGVGSLLPLFISVVQQSHWSEPMRATVGVAICAAAAVVTTYTAGNLDIHHLSTTFALVYGAAQVTYRNFWKPVKVAPAIEAKTTKKRKVVHHHGHQ